MTTDDRVRRLLAATSPRPVAGPDLSDDLVLRKDLGIDSIALVTVVFQFEDEFDVDLLEVDADFSGIETVGDMLAKARQILATKEAHP